jgi:hypothetical protein
MSKIENKETVIKIGKVSQSNGNYYGTVSAVMLAIAPLSVVPIFQAVCAMFGYEPEVNINFVIPNLILPLVIFHTARKELVDAFTKREAFKRHNNDITKTKIRFEPSP